MSSTALETMASDPSTTQFFIPWKRYRGAIALVFVLLLLTIFTDGTFLTPRNLTNLTRQVAINGILAIGMTYVILIGGMDLSIGAVVALSGVIAGLTQVQLAGMNGEGGLAYAGAFLSILSAVGVGTLCGVFNGWMITRHRVTPFIITLGMMVIARGLALIFSKGAAVAPLGEAFNVLGQGYLDSRIVMAVIGVLGVGIALRPLLKRPQERSVYLHAIGALFLVAASLWIFLGYRGLPIPVLIFGVLGMLGVFILQKTRLGRFILAIGGNTEAAWLAGVPIKKIIFGIYVMLGSLSGLCGAILASRLNGALPTAGELFELDAIAAVVMGGTSLTGGMGSVHGSILGAFFMGALNNGMSLLDVPEFYQKVIKGVIIILAVWIDMRQSSQRASR